MKHTTRFSKAFLGAFQPFYFTLVVSTKASCKLRLYLNFCAYWHTQKSGFFDQLGNICAEAQEMFFVKRQEDICF
jgi:hypothetical protein